MGTLDIALRRRLLGGLALGCLSCGLGSDERNSDTAASGSGIASLGDATQASEESVGDDSSGPMAPGGSSEGGAEAGTTAPADGSATGDGPKFDIGAPAGESGSEGGCETERCECTIPEHTPCDAGTNDLFRAVGLNCPGELQVDASTSGPAMAMGVRSAFGGTNTFDPREGDVYAVIASGRIDELDDETPGGDFDFSPTYCNDDIGNFDPGGSLPAPLVPTDTAGDCAMNPGLIGTGDCSRTIQEQFDQGGEANDYVEMRFELDVPPDVISFSYDFAFFSTEYPFYYGSAYNDMYVGWLESELWTGNISFDAMGNPISLNAGFLDFTDDGGNLAEFDGTCMKQHAGTDWLTTTAGVSPGEHITVVFAIFDLSDSILDSYAFIDDFQWGCDPTGTPQTEPEG